MLAARIPFYYFRFNSNWGSAPGERYGFEQSGAVFELVAHYVYTADLPDSFDITTLIDLLVEAEVPSLISTRQYLRLLNLLPFSFLPPSSCRSPI